MNAYGVSKLTFEGALHASRPNRAVSLRRCAFFLSLTPSSPPHMSRPMFPIYIYIAPASCSRSSLICGPRTPGACRKQSFLQFCQERLRAGEPTDFFNDEAPIHPN